MKTFIAIFALVASANVAMASGNLRVDILPINTERAVVAISSNSASQYEISIKDATGEVIYYKETEGTTSDYRKIFDFSKLEAGDYSVVASINGETSVRNFTIGQEIAVGNMSYVVDPVFSFDENILRVSFLNYPGEEVSLHVYDGNELIYSKSIENSFAVNEGLNLSKLAGGNYQVVLATANDVFDYSISK